MRTGGTQDRNGQWIQSAAVIAAALIVATSLFISRADDDDEVRQVIAMPGTLEGLPFSPAIRVDDLIFLSGQVGADLRTLELVEGGLEAETRQTMENIRLVLEAAGAGFEDIVKCSIFLEDIADWPAFNEIYGEYFEGMEHPPARSAFGTTGLALGATVEVDCIAAAPGDN
jgi:reactive intermediate/imine deaminase